MKRITLILCLLCIAALKVPAQKAAKSIYGEIGGPGLVSANYDVRFAKKENGFGARVGIGGFADADLAAVSIPFGINYLLGNDGKNYFESGVGGAYLNSVSDFFGNNHSSNFLGHLTLGYRYQPQKSGFLFRACLTPVFGDGFFIPYYGSFSFGYKL